MKTKKVPIFCGKKKAEFVRKRNFDHDSLE
jgi:hypothetical protein